MERLWRGYGVAWGGIAAYVGCGVAELRGNKTATLESSLIVLGNSSLKFCVLGLVYY